MARPGPDTAFTDAPDPRGRVIGLCKLLRHRGVQVTLSDEIRATLLAERLERSGRGLRSGADWARWITPVIARDETAQRDVAEAIEVEARRPEVEMTRRRVVKHMRRVERTRAGIRRVMPLLATMLLVVVGGAVTLLLRDVVEGFGPVEVAPDEAQPDREIEIETSFFSDFEPLRIAQLFLPFGVLAIWLGRFLRTGPGWLVRTRGRRRPRRDLPIPEVETEVLTDDSADLAVTTLAAPNRIPSRRLDVRATIRGTVASGGHPDIVFRERLVRYEYVLLVERQGASDHVELISGALQRRLRAIDAHFTTFEVLGSVARLRHASGVRSGDRVMTLSEMAEEHRGARLILIGTGGSLFERGTGALSGAPGFARSGSPARVFGGFSAPVLLTTTPRGRWGDRESRLEADGLAVLPATGAGLLEAARLGAFDAPERRRPQIARGADRFLAELDVEAERLVSNIAPPDEEADRLVWRLERYLGADDGARMLCALAELPVIFPHLTSYAALFVLAKPGDDGSAERTTRPMPEPLALALARLPWLRAGRLPDWLRLAILRAAGRERREETLRALAAMLRDLEFRREMETVGAARPAARGGQRFAITGDVGVAYDLARRLGLQLEFVEGEGVVERFGRRRDPSALALPSEAERRPVRPAVAAAIAGVLITGGVLAYLAEGPAAALAETLFDWPRFVGRGFAMLYVCTAVLYLATLFDVVFARGPWSPPWWRFGLRMQLRRDMAALARVMRRLGKVMGSSERGGAPELVKLAEDLKRRLAAARRRPEDEAAAARWAIVVLHFCLFLPLPLLEYQNSVSVAAGMLLAASLLVQLHWVDRPSILRLAQPGAAATAPSPPLRATSALLMAGTGLVIEILFFNETLLIYFSLWIVGLGLCAWTMSRLTTAFSTVSLARTAFRDLALVIGCTTLGAFMLAIASLTFSATIFPIILPLYACFAATICRSVSGPVAVALSQADRRLADPTDVPRPVFLSRGDLLFQTLIGPWLLLLLVIYGYEVYISRLVDSLFVDEASASVFSLWSSRDDLYASEIVSTTLALALGYVALGSTPFVRRGLQLLASLGGRFLLDPDVSLPGMLSQLASIRAQVERDAPASDVDAEKAA